jgi:hypothetical protein
MISNSPASEPSVSAASVRRITWASLWAGMMIEIIEDRLQLAEIHHHQVSATENAFIRLGRLPEPPLRRQGGSGVTHIDSTARLKEVGGALKHLFGIARTSSLN